MTEREQSADGPSPTPARGAEGPSAPVDGAAVEMQRLRYDYEARRVEARSRVLQAIFGTMIVGLAAAAFPFAQKYAELTFQQSIEAARHDAELAALQARNALEKELADTQAALEQASQSAAAQRERREFLNSLAAEARSEDIGKRIVLAEFFSHLAHGEEIAKWERFLQYLQAQQKGFNAERATLTAVLRDPTASQGDVDEALNRLRQIEQLESPQASAATTAAPACGSEPIDIEPVAFEVVEGRLRQADGAFVSFRETPNKSGRLTGGAPRYVIMNFTASGSAGSFVNFAVDPNSRASSHLIVDRDGSITQMGLFDEKLWHAGRSEWDGLRGMNSYAVGVELVNFGRLQQGADGWRSWSGAPIDGAEVCRAAHKHEPEQARGWQRFTQRQLNAAAGAVQAVAARYGVPVENVIGHEDVSPGRKSDPGPAFPWTPFRAAVAAGGR